MDDRQVIIFFKLPISLTCENTVVASWTSTATAHEYSDIFGPSIRTFFPNELRI